MPSLVIFGAGDTAKIAHYYFSTDSDLEVAGFCVDEEFLSGDSYLGLPLVSSAEVVKRFPPDRHQMFIALTYAQMNRLRESRYHWSKALGYRCPSYVSSRATVLNEGKIGDNCFILENNTIQPFSVIGNNVTLWSGNHVGHDAVIEDHCFISSHVVISGHVRIGNNSFLGVNSTLKNGITIGSHCLIGAGAIVMEDTPADSVYACAPAQRRKVTSDKIKL